MIQQRTGLTIVSFGVSLILLTLISLHISGSSEAYAQATNMTQSKNDNRSLIGSVINITNQTNPIGGSGSTDDAGNFNFKRNLKFKRN